MISNHLVLMCILGSVIVLGSTLLVTNRLKMRQKPSKKTASKKLIKRKK